jgi:HAMP domain-containing protein
MIAIGESNLACGDAERRVFKVLIFPTNGNRRAPASYALELSRLCDACATGAGKAGRVGSVTRSAVDRRRGRSRGSGSHSTLSVSHYAPYRTHGAGRRPDVNGMLSEIILAVLALATGFLVIGDFARTRDEILPDHANETPHDAWPRMAADIRGSRPGPFLREPADVHDAAPARRAESIGPVGHDHPYSPNGPAHKTPRRGLKDWPVRSRLLLLVITPAVAVAVGAFCVVRITDILRGAPNHSPSVRAVLSALAIGVVMIIVLMLASWFTILAARSVLHPLNRLRVGAVKMSRAELPDAARRVTKDNGDGGPPDSEPIGIDSSDEIGQVARAFDQMHREMLRLSTSETAVRGNLDAMCVNLSQRSQSLAERQMRLIQRLEQGERDRDRLASLFKMNHIAARMHRNSQNLLIVAGRDLATSWNQPVALVNVIRAAVSEIEEYERVSFNAQPDIAVRGPAVNDVVHLLAELIENATSFSAARCQSKSLASC